MVVAHSRLSLGGFLPAPPSLEGIGASDSTSLSSSHILSQGFETGRSGLPDPWAGGRGVGRMCGPAGNTGLFMAAYLNPCGNAQLQDRQAWGF